MAQDALQRALSWKGAEPCTSHTCIFMSSDDALQTGASTSIGMINMIGTSEVLEENKSVHRFPVPSGHASASLRDGESNPHEPKTTAHFNMVAKHGSVQRDRTKAPASVQRNQQQGVLQDSLEEQICQRAEHCELVTSEEPTIFKVMVLTDREVKELQVMMQTKLEAAGASYSKFIERMTPPIFNGNYDEFDAWRQRFIMFIELRSVALARGLQNVHDIPPRMTLPEIVCNMVQAVEGLNPEQSHRLASTYLESGRELCGFLQAALRDADLDRAILPSCQGSGFEAWRLLHEKYKPVTSGGMIGELREIILKTNLFIWGKH